MEKENKNQGLVVGFIVVLVLLIVSISYIVYDKMQDDKPKNNDNNQIGENTNQDNDVVNDANYNKGNLSVDDKKVLELYEIVTSSPGCYENNIANIDYKLIDYYIENKITNQIKLKLGFALAENEGWREASKKGEILSSVTKDSVEKSIKKIFGESSEYVLEDLKFLDGNVFAEFDNGYSVMQGCGGGIDTRSYIDTMLYAASKDEKHIYLTEKIIFVDIKNYNRETYDFDADIYSDYQKTNTIVKDLACNKAPRVKEYINKASTYQYTFTLEDGNYYFTDFKKIG